MLCSIWRDIHAIPLFHWLQQRRQFRSIFSCPYERVLEKRLAALDRQSRRACLSVGSFMACSWGSNRTWLGRVGKLSVCKQPDKEQRSNSALRISFPQLNLNLRRSWVLQKKSSPTCRFDAFATLGQCECISLHQ